MCLSKGEEGKQALGETGPEKPAPVKEKPNSAQRRYLVRGLAQPGGKLPLFDEDGQQVHPAVVKACVTHGWAEPWFANPIKADWQICKLTENGRRILSEP